MSAWTGRKVMRLRKLIYARDNGICAICGQPAPLELGHVDHIIARANGGSNQARNLQWTHAKCNLRKGTTGGTNTRQRPSETAQFPISLPVDSLW